MRRAATTAAVLATAALLAAAGHPISGAELVIDGDLPIGGGLASSASLELGVCVALLALAGVKLEQDVVLEGDREQRLPRGADSSTAIATPSSPFPVAHATRASSTSSSVAPSKTGVAK